MSLDPCRDQLRRISYGITEVTIQGGLDMIAGYNIKDKMN